MQQTKYWLDIQDNLYFTWCLRRVVSIHEQTSPGSNTPSIPHKALGHVITETFIESCNQEAVIINIKQPRSYTPSSPFPPTVTLCWSILSLVDTWVLCYSEHECAKYLFKILLLVAYSEVSLVGPMVVLCLICLRNFCGGTEKVLRVCEVLGECVLLIWLHHVKNSNLRPWRNGKAFTGMGRVRGVQGRGVEKLSLGLCVDFGSVCRKCSS